MLPVSVPDLRGREQELLAECVATNWISSVGGMIPRLEATLAERLGARFAIATCNGTCALEVALRAAGLRVGDRVLLPDWTFAATANAVVHAGAVPVFCDVDPGSWCISALTAQNALDEAETPIWGIVAVHALGHPAAMPALTALAEDRGLILVEDAAGALGAKLGGRAAGTFGVAGILSFNGNKLVTCGGGGMILTDDPELAERARAYSSQSRSDERYRHDAPGFNYRMTNLNAAVGLAQMERLDEMMARRKAIFRAYETGVAGLAAYRFAPRQDWAETNCWMSAVRCADRAAAHALITNCRAAGVGAALFWEALSEQPAYAAFPAVPAPVCAALSGAVVALPCSSNLEDSDVKHVIAILQNTAKELPTVPDLPGSRAA